MKLLELVPLPYRWLAMALLVAAVWGTGWLQGAHHEELARVALEVGIDKEREGFVERQAERKRLSDAFIAKGDQKREDDLRDAHRWWAGYVERMQRGDGGAGEAKEPVRVTSKICDNPARDQQLSGAIAVSRSDLRRAVGAYRAGIGRLLAACELQATDLINVQEWAQYEQLLHHQPQ